MEPRGGSPKISLQIGGKGRFGYKQKSLENGKKICAANPRGLVGLKN